MASPQWRRSFFMRPGLIIKKPALAVKINCWDRYDLRCHPAWRMIRPLSAYGHDRKMKYRRRTDICRILITEIQRSGFHTMQSLHFRSPSEVHSAKHLTPRSHHPQLSHDKEVSLTHSSSTVYGSVAYSTDLCQIRPWSASARQRKQSRWWQRTFMVSFYK